MVVLRLPARFCASCFTRTAGEHWLFECCVEAAMKRASFADVEMACGEKCQHPDVELRESSSERKEIL